MGAARYAPPPSHSSDPGPSSKESLIPLDVWLDISDDHESYRLDGYAVGEDRDREAIENRSSAPIAVLVEQVELD
jgi:hypothetical protein